MRKGDKDALETVLDECIAAGMPELDTDIHRARKALDDQDELDDRIRRGQESFTSFCFLSILLLLLLLSLLLLLLFSFSQ